MKLLPFFFFFFAFGEAYGFGFNQPTGYIETSSGSSDGYNSIQEDGFDYEAFRAGEYCQLQGNSCEKEKDMTW